MSVTDRAANKSEDGSDKVKPKAGKRSNKDTHDGQGNAFQINDEPQQPGEDAEREPKD